MYGVAVYNVCKGEYVWWTGLEWTKTPVAIGPFFTLVDANTFANNRKGAFVYVQNDPFGCNPESAQDHTTLHTND
jgi:hypothetical protein